jgi:hypothetical protein
MGLGMEVCCFTERRVRGVTVRGGRKTVAWVVIQMAVYIYIYPALSSIFISAYLLLYEFGVLMVS